ncbi:bifunctional 4-hydroxy-2-oxoglutarate aldolase/2-dehydro-3-deoxy-phosphogluconate aldolase [Clostridium sp. AN503]|uniref:bifunctional 4-hydroxy-2-oxoglutarate aldolase/2-dehydro-3-deoxy-phosphogluconate aldolase n=1 Tax=Clostridium sp. AN503 TaxID=3160598 RepID=UPI003459587C
MTERKKEVLDSIRRNRLVVIARDIIPEDVLESAKALYKGGIRLMEITFSQETGRMEATAESIALVRKHLPDDMTVGAGTVLTQEQLICARDAGAEFILSPGADEAVIKLTRAMGLVSIPGALTASEIYEAYAWGADVVKLFPAGVMGTGYLKAVRGPLSHIPLMMVGGISEDNIGEFLKAGAVSFGVGSNILKREYIRNQDYEAVTELARTYLSRIKEAGDEAILDNR